MFTFTKKISSLPKRNENDFGTVDKTDEYRSTGQVPPIFTNFINKRKNSKATESVPFHEMSPKMINFKVKTNFNEFKQSKERRVQSPNGSNSKSLVSPIQKVPPFVKLDNKDLPTNRSTIAANSSKDNFLTSLNNMDLYSKYKLYESLQKEHALQVDKNSEIDSDHDMLPIKTSNQRKKMNFETFSQVGIYHQNLIVLELHNMTKKTRGNFDVATLRTKVGKDKPAMIIS